MDKTFSDLMDIVNRSKKYDAPAPKQRARKVEPPVEEEYTPREYDIVEEKPKRKSPVKSTSSSLSNSKLGSLIEKTTKATTKKATTAKSSTKTSTAKKSQTAKKAPAKTTKTTETKKATAPKADKLNALLGNVNKAEKVEKVEKAPEVIAETPAPEVEKPVEQPVEKKVEMPKFELPAARPKVKPAKSVTEKAPENDKDAQLYAALKNSLFSGGTDISEYLTANEEMEMSQQTYQDNRIRQEASKINEEISKEQQEYEQLFTGSFSSFYDTEEIEDDNNETFERDEKNPHDSTYELNTGNRNLDQKIADYYKRKQEMIDKYNSEEEDYTETKKEDNNDVVDYDAIFGGTMVSRDELLGEKEEPAPATEETPVEETTDTTITAETSAFATTEETTPVEENTTEELVETTPVVEETTETPVEAVATEQPVEATPVVAPTTNSNEEHLKSVLHNILYANEEEEVVADKTATEDTTPYSNFTGSVEEKPAVNGENFVMTTPEPEPVGEVMEYSNQVPVDYTTMTKVEEIVEPEPVVEERKSLLSAYVTNVPQPVVDEDDDDEELVIKLDNNEYATEQPVAEETAENIVYANEEINRTAEETIEPTAETPVEETTNSFTSVYESRNMSLEDESAVVVDSENTVSSLVEESAEVEEEETDFNAMFENNNPVEETVPVVEETTENIIEEEHHALFYPTEEEKVETPVEETINEQSTEETQVEEAEEAIEETEEVEEEPTETYFAVENEQDTEDEGEELADTMTEEPVDNSIFTPEPVEEMTEEEKMEEELLETYLTDDERYDYIVTNERLFEEHNRPQTTNEDIVEEYLENNDADNTIVMSGLPETRFDLFGTQPTTPVVEETVEETPVEETAEQDDDTISKEEFYKEMARLQDNLINELKGNIVEKSSYDFFAEKPEPEPVVEETPAPVVEEIDENEKINTIVDELIAVAPATEEVSIVEQVLNRNAETTPVETPVVEETPVEEKKEETNIFGEEVGSKAEPVDPADFDKYNLLHKNVALSEEDLKVETSVVEADKQDTYFYGSNEDKEKKASVVDEYMTIYNEEAHSSKEVGDINFFKNLGNAVPSSEILKEKLNEQTTTSSESDEDDKDLETIYTLMGIERKPAPKEEKEIKVLYCASECQPFVASGGLADVAGSLPKAIAEKGNVDIRVIMPLYGNIKAEYRDKFEYLGNFTVHLSWRQEYCGLFRYFKDGVTYYFIDNERYFKRDTLYGYYDDGERFAYFSKAIVEALPHLNFFPDIMHCNDWQTALVSTYIKTGNWSDHRYYKIRFVYTIHNVEYQGVYGMENLKDLFGIDYRFKNDIEYNGDINLTKAAIQYCDKLTTVSNSYCDNLKQPYCSRGLHHIIIRNEYKLSGIINGIDYQFYNPATDTVIFKNYDIGCIEEKVLNKKLWQDEIGLPVDGDTPMIAIVSRLVGHKGLDLVAKIIHNILQQDIQLVVVGTGDDKYVDLFHSLEQKYPTKVRAFVDKYSNEIARKAYAASDIFVMPSKIEPCGLSQMISSRYGSVPIVREVGGLKDTIRDFGCEGGGNGYTFANYNPNDLQYQIERAIKDYSNRTQWKEKMKICMSQDYTWSKPAVNYINLYKSISN